MTTPTLPPDAKSHREDLVDALAILSEANTRLVKLQATINDAFLDSIDEHRKEYTALQESIEKATETAITIARMHPEWFADSKTIETLYGSVQSRSTTKLEVANEAVTIQLLQQLGPSSAPFLRTTVTLNLEALNILPDDELKRIRVERVKSESITVKTTAPKLGKSVNAATKKAKKAEQAAKREAAKEKADEARMS
jgi:hypothetical protein